MAVAPVLAPVLAPVVRRVLPWVAGLAAVQGAGVLTGRLLARRHDEGDDTTAGIRRFRLMGGTALHPHHPELSRVRLDLVMAGAEVDLGRVPRVPGGVDLTVRAWMSGVEVRVPGDWRVWVRATGAASGVAVDPRLERTDDERGADLRVHATAVAAGVTVEPA
ncbi:MULTISPECIES: hypothetical protein [unclassified Blastococcus]